MAYPQPYRPPPMPAPAPAARPAAAAPSSEGMVPRGWGPRPPTQYELDQQRTQAQLIAMANAQKEYGFSSSVDSPSGVSYTTGRVPGAPGTGTGGASGNGYTGLPFDLNSMWGATGFMGSSAPPTMPMPPPVTGPSAADRAAAEAAAYGKAKDQTGMESRASLDALANEMSSRGMTDSTFMANAAGGILQRGQGEMGDVDRQLAQDDLKRKSEVEDRDYAGQVAQRDQTMRWNESQQQLQEMAQQRRQQLMMALLQFQAQTGSRAY